MVPEMSKGAFHGGDGCLKESRRDGNLEMCPEATVAGLYYLTALAITRTVDLLKEMDKSWRKGKDQIAEACERVRVIRQHGDSQSNRAGMCSIRKPRLSSGKHSTASRGRSSSSSSSSAAENPSPHFRIIYFHLRHIFLHHPTATSLYYSLVLVNQRSRQESTQYACKMIGTTYLLFHRLTYTSAVKPANAATIYTAVPSHCAMPKLQRREQS